MPEFFEVELGESLISRTETLGECGSPTRSQVASRTKPESVNGHSGIYRNIFNYVTTPLLLRIACSLGEQVSTCLDVKRSFR